MSKWPPTRGSKGHFESPGYQISMQSSRFRLCESCFDFSSPVKGEKFRGNLLQEMPIATMHMRLSGEVKGEGH